MARSELLTTDELAIKNKWTQARIATLLMDEWRAPDKLRAMTTQMCDGGARNSLNSAIIARWLGYSPNTSWAQMAHELSHDPTNLRNSDIAEILYGTALDEAEHDEDMMLMQVAQTVGYGLSKHVAEKTLVDEIENIEMADADAEHDEIDVRIDGKNAQVITTKKDETKNYTGKSWEEKYDADDADDVNFDVYVVAHVSNDGETLGVATEEVKNEYEKTRASTRAKNALK